MWELGPLGHDGVAGEMALHVLDDDDGVVDDQSGGEGDAEEGERVDGKAEDLDEGEGADERHGNGHGGGGRGAPVPQEEREGGEEGEEVVTESRGHSSGR